MRAAVLERFGEPLALREIEPAVAGAGDVVVRTTGCGICRTDLHMIDGLAYRPSLPHILGHEAAGEIVAVGDGVEGWAVGDRVATYLFETCGHCAACAAGSDAQCEHPGDIFGITRDGGFAEAFRARAANLLRVPQAVDLSTAGLVSCAAVTAVHAAHRAALEPGQQVALIGAGGIGLLIVQLLTSRGYTVHVVEPDRRRRAFAEQFGAASVHSLDSTGMPSGVDRVFDLVGTGASTALAATLVRRQGRVVVIGEEPEFPGVNTIALAQREIELVGSRNGSREEAREALALIAAGVIRPLIGGRVALADINDALAAMRAGRVDGRIIVEPQR